MIFNSISFFPFFLITIVAYFLLQNWSHKKILLLVASYVFYGFFNPWYILLLGAATLGTWQTANICQKQKSKLWLIIGVSIPLLFLGYFKYTAFVTGNVAWLFDYWDVNRSWSVIDVALPVGISFYLFQSLSYVIDVYRGEKTASLLDYALYVSFFPQLVAGPIVRAHDFLPQLKEPTRGKVDWKNINWGLTIFVFGLFQKMLLADTLFSNSSETVFTNSASLGFIDAWTGVLAFTGQIYFDFAGYSTCAIGIALCFGFRLPINFMYPYASIGFSDFWRRWHISLSSWLRDYLYISLGGNRKGRLNTYRNLFLTMVLGGLWHGASWNFVIWGTLHGLFLIGERLVRRFFPKKTNLFMSLAGWFTTFLLTMLAWVFFRAGTFVEARQILGSMFSLDNLSSGLISNFSAISVALGIAATLVYSAYMRKRTFSDVWVKLPTLTKALLLAVCIFCMIIWRDTQSEFIYFKF